MLGLLNSMVLVLLGASLAHSQSPIITKHPASLVDAIDGQTIKLSVEASGPALNFRWLRNDTPITTGTNATLSVFARLTNAGTYHVVVSNSFGSVRSSNTVLRVVPDTFGPRILQVFVEADETNRVLVQVDEDLSLRMAGTNNFLVTEIATGNRLPVTLAQVAQGNGQVRLTLASALDRTKNYQVCFFNIADYRTNFMALNSCVPIGFEVETNIFTFASTWSFYCDTGPPPLDWNEFRHVPQTPGPWCDGYAMFYDSFLSIPPCSFPQTMLISTPPYYLRRTFTVSSNILGFPVTAILGTALPRMTGGAIFYLNGTEILRTFPWLDTPDCWTDRIAVGHLLARTNVLAVKLPGGFFDASLTLRYTRPPVLTNPPPPTDVFLRHSNHSPAQLRLYWTNGTGYALEYVEAFGDQWRELQPPSTNMLIEKTGHSRFYRLNKRH